MRAKPVRNLYLPAPGLNQLRLLSAIAAGPRITQAELARISDLSLAMVNNYMKELCGEGLLEYRRSSARTVSYHLTEAGKGRLCRLRRDLLADLVALFEEAKVHVRDAVANGASGPQRVVICGTGALAEIAFHALLAAGVRVIGICDDDPALLGRDWCGREITRSSQIRYMGPDAVVIADTERCDEIRRNLGHLASLGIRLVRLGWPAFEEAVAGSPGTHAEPPPAGGGVQAAAAASGEGWGGRGVL